MFTKIEKYLKHWNQHLFLLIFLLAIVVIELIDIRRFIADDSYFYMTIARNLALFGKQTFSGLVPTNGAHPLWLYTLTFSYWVISLINAQQLYNPLSIVPISLLVLIIGILASWKSASILGLNKLLFTIIPVGFLCAFNLIGSEANLAYASISILVFLSLNLKNKRTNAILIGLAALAVVFSRLDYIFFVLIYYGWLAKKGNLRFLTLSIGVFLIPFLIYIYLNMINFGGPIPISGWLKSSFPKFSLAGFTYEKLGSQLSGYNIVFGIVPIVYSTITLYRFRKKIEGPIKIVWALLGGCVLHFIYTASFTWNATGWLWYYVLPVFLGTFVYSLNIKLLRNGVTQQLFKVLGLVIIPALFLGYSMRTATREITWEEQAVTMTEFLLSNDIENSIIIVGDSAGETAFFSSNQVISLDMLTLNRYFVEEMLASENGLKYIITRFSEYEKPTYLLWTTGTWLGDLNFSDNLRIVSYRFKTPDKQTYQDMGSINIGEPILVSENLIVWELSIAER
jgi:hypothetical protein